MMEQLLNKLKDLIADPEKREKMQQETKRSHAIIGKALLELKENIQEV